MFSTGFDVLTTNTSPLDPVVWPQRDIYYIPFSDAKTDPFDLKKHRSTQPPPLEKKTLLRSGKR